MNIQTLKGFRDFLPKEARKRQYVIDTLRKVFESYGFEPLETPTLEYDELLTGKYGEEGDKLIYRFVDKGGRKVAMRYDQTVPTARVVAQYLPNLPTPYKRYQIQNVFRADNTQKGRYREFTQCDADIFGISSAVADAEILAVVYDAYEKLGLDVLFKVNDRQLLKDIPEKALPVLDKLIKIGEDGVLKELEQKGFSLEEGKELLKQINSSQKSVYLDDVLSVYEELGKPSNSWEFDPTLVRGLDYYTGLIFEVVLKDSPRSSSLCGGGRFDNLIGMFAKKSIPAVGFAIGFDRTVEAMEDAKLFSDELITTKILVTIFSKELEEKSIEISAQLRSNNINTELWIEPGAKMEKQLKYADQKGIPYVVILGPEEVEKNLVTLKDLKKRSQEKLPLEDLIKKLS